MSSSMMSSGLGWLGWYRYPGENTARSLLFSEFLHGIHDRNYTNCNYVKKEECFYNLKTSKSELYLGVLDSNSGSHNE